MSSKFGQIQMEKGFEIGRGLLGQGHIKLLSQHQQVFHENRVIEGRWRGCSRFGEVCWAKTISLICYSINSYLVKIGLRPNRGGSRLGDVCWAITSRVPYHSSVTALTGIP